MLARELGERRIIELLTAGLRRSPRAIADFDDDAAIVKVGGKLLALTTDMGTGATHFTSTDSRKMGRKIITSNASDLLAKGALPKYALVSIGFPPETRDSFLKQLYRGMDEKLEEFNAYLVGGDTNEAAEFVYSVAMIGEIEGNPLLRSTAKVGDNVLLTGEIGSAGAGYLMRKRGLKGGRVFLDAQDDPQLDFGLCRKMMKEAHAGIDVSDGLAFELNELARLGGKKIVIDWKKLPLHPELEKFCAKNRLNEVEVALHHGEDYQVAYCSQSGAHGFRIGKIEEGRGVFLKKGGVTKRLEARGYEHFRNNSLKLGV